CPVAERDPRGFLSAVLQRVETEVGEFADFFAGCPDPEDTAGVLRAAFARIEVHGKPTVGIRHTHSLVPTGGRSVTRGGSVPTEAGGRTGRRGRHRPEPGARRPLVSSRPHRSPDAARSTGRSPPPPAGCRVYVEAPRWPAQHRTGAPVLPGCHRGPARRGRPECRARPPSRRASRVVRHPPRLRRTHAPLLRRCL